MHVFRIFDDYCDFAVRFMAKRSWVAFALVLCVSLMIFLSGLYDIPPMDRDETRFAQASKQMLETSEFIDIKFQDETRYKKPVGIYWLQAGMVSLVGDDSLKRIGDYRLISVIGALITAVGTFFLGRRLFGREAGVIAAFLVPLPILVSVEAHLAKTDSMMVGLTTLSFYGLACLWRRAYSGRESAFSLRHFLIFWIALGCGILIKGVNLIVILVAIIALCVVRKDIKWLAPLRVHYGILILAVIIVPWFYSIMHLSQGAFIDGSVKQDFFAKILSGVENHFAPPLTYLMTHFAVFWPVALLTPLAFWCAWKNRNDERFMFCLWSLLPMWIIFECVPTKLPHYTYPLYPLLFVLIAGMIAKILNREYFFPKRLFIISSGLYIIVTLILAVGLPVISHYLGAEKDIILMTLGGVSFLLGVCVLYMVRHDMLHGGVALLGVQALVVLPYFYGAVFPKMDDIRIADKMVAAIERSGCADTAVRVSGYLEPSVVFKVGTQVKLMTSPQIIQDFNTATPCSLAFVGENHEQFAQIFPDVKPIDTIIGRNINGGDLVKLELYRR